MMAKTQVAKAIRQKRKALGLTQKELAELLGLKEAGERTVRGWENGEHTPSKTKIDVILGMGEHIPFRSKPSAKQNFAFIDLFAGIGGMRLPFQELGGKCVFTSEWDKFAKKTYAANFGEVPEGDITKIAANKIPPHDVLLAGFPCQAFSQAGRRKGFLDTRGTMFFEIHRILAHHRPKAFLLENVKQLKGHDKGKTLATILAILRGEVDVDIPEDAPLSPEARASLLHRLNYAVDFRVLKSTDFGVPQKRERVYIVGFDKDVFGDVDVAALFDRLQKTEGNITLGDILEDSAKLDNRYTISDQLLAGHERRKIEHKKKGNGFGYSLFNRQSPYCNTISARYYKDGSEVLIDQSDIGKNPRKLTPRECARIQGFPEDFCVDAVSETQIYRQFGNSVSMPVIREIAKQIASLLNYSYEADAEKMSKAG